MNFSPSDKTSSLASRLTAFMETHVYPAEAIYREHVRTARDRWTIPPIMEALKDRARKEGLWNLWAPGEVGQHGLSNLDYAPLCEIMGRSLIGAEVFNCSAPDTGNMEVFLRYGTEDQKRQWLEPLLAGTIRSAFCMTEPAVASSDATNIQCAITFAGDDVVINGRKWWASGALDPRCKILIVMGKTDPAAERHKQQSMVLVPIGTPGVTMLRPMEVYADDDAPHGHAEILFENVRVPKQNILLGEGRGFEIAQGRLGPGRIHHCMRLIGCAQRALEMMCQRASTRVAFGRPLAEQGSVREDIARSACEIAQARLLTLAAADKMDREGNKKARDMIAMIKIVAPLMAQEVIDRAVQLHGAMGISQDTFLADAWKYARYCRLADGPDAVHRASLGKQLLGQYSNPASSK